MNLLGLDVGTTGCKAILFDSDGTLLARAGREYPVDFPQPLWAEQDLENVWRLAQAAIAETLSISGARAIEAIGLSVHGEAITPVDARGVPLHPTILGMDSRCGPQNDWLREHFGAEPLFQKTGMPIHTINSLPKLLWIKQNEPEIWKKANKFLLVEDYLLQRMTGQARISECLASRTQLFDLKQGSWSEEILAALELDPERLATIQPSGSPAGSLSSDLASRLGLASTPLVVTGGHDQACGALGCGLTRPGLAMVSTGSAEVVEAVMSEPTLSRPLFEGNLSVYRHVVPGLFLAMTLNHSGGMSLRWFRDEFCEPQLQASSLAHIDAYDLILADTSAGPTGLLVLPHFAGSGTPALDTASKGVIVGLTFATRRADTAKAILEGLTYELRLNLEILQAGGVKIETLRAVGGGARSPLWLQLKADITGLQIVTPRITEAAAFGAALLAGVGAGIFTSAKQAAESFLELTSEYHPDPDRHKAYSSLYELYRQVYPSLAPILHKL